MECETKKQICDDLEAPAGKKMRPCDYAEYDSHVDQLADRLNIARHPDNSVTIKAARLLIENILLTKHDDKEVVRKGDEEGKQEKKKGSSGEIRIQQSKFDLNDVSLPTTIFSVESQASTGLVSPPPPPTTTTTEASGDVKKDDLLETFIGASKALKLLYLNDQKQLQNQVNEITSLIQSVTANPKTDPRLLTTGR